MLLSILNSQSSKLFRGFTLAEVLITIGIIGVVSALTIPTLMQKTNEKELVSQTLKSASILSNAYQTSEVTEGITKLETIEEFSQSLERHLKRLNGTCDYDVCLTDGSGYRYNEDFSEGCTTDNSDKGESSSLKNTCVSITMDVNGKRGPNISGKDVYTFYLTKYGVVPAGNNLTCSGLDCTNYVLSHHKLYNGELAYTPIEPTPSNPTEPTPSEPTPPAVQLPSYCASSDDNGATCTLADGTTATRATVNGKDVYVTNRNTSQTWANARNSCPSGTSLPDISTLQALRDQPGMPTGGWFWSSSEYSSYTAYSLNFGSGSTGKLNKKYTYGVLCVGDVE